MVLPKPVGSTAITYLPDRRALTTTFCSCWVQCVSHLIETAKAISCFSFPRENQRQIGVIICQEVINSSKKSDSASLSTDQSEFPVARAMGDSESVGYRRSRTPSIFAKSPFSPRSACAEIPTLPFRPETPIFWEDSEPPVFA